jgi:uncharacterized protein (DUF2267 family)
MDYDTFVAHVEERGRTGRAAAERAADATLRVLAERITPKEVHDLAAQLPGPLQRSLLEARADREIFPTDEFARRVAERLQISPSEARLQAHAVLVTLREAVSEGELEDVLVQLSPDYLDLIAPDFPVPDPREDGRLSFGLSYGELESRFQTELARQTGFDGDLIGALTRVLTEVIGDDHERMRVQLERAGLRW